MRPTLRGRFDRKTVRKDLVAGLVLGVESVPDGLASGLLAGVNPLAGLYGYLFGMVGAAFATSSAFMAVQATGAMALVVGDAGLGTRPDPERALFTLSMLTGVILVAAGLLKVGRLVRFVPTAVMTGFLTAVGVNIVLGQLGNLTGYDGQGGNRIIRTIDLVIHVSSWSLTTLVVGLLTIGIILLLARTPVGSLGLVIAVIVASASAALFDVWFDHPVALISDLVEVCIVQGAGVSAGLPTSNGRPANASRDVLGQGVGNLVAGVFQGMPVGGSMSASVLVVAAGAKTRLSLFIAGAVMALVILVASGLVSFVAMPALAGLLIVIGVTSIRPSRVMSVVKTGPLQTSIMAVTFVLTLIIPLQFAVLMGVGLGIVLFVAQQSNRVRVRQVHIADDGRMRESDPVDSIPADGIVILQPYGSLFFASAPVFDGQLPAVRRSSSNAVVIVRLRGTDQLGLALIDVLRRYAGLLRDADSSLKIVASEPRVLTQIRVSGLLGDIGSDNLYEGGEWVGEALRRAYDDARDEIRED